MGVILGSMPRTGWTKPDTDDRLSDYVSLGVLTRVFPPGAVDDAIDATHAREQRQRLLPARVVVYYVIALAIYAQDSYEEVMRRLLMGLSWLAGGAEEVTIPSKVAIFKARTRLGSAPLIELFDRVVAPLSRLPPTAQGLAAKRVVSIDGTVLDLADTPANERYYGRPGTKTEAKSAFPQIRLVGLVETTTHAIIAAATSACHTAEIDLVPALLYRISRDMIIVADRGFFSYTLIKDLLATGADVLVRVRANTVLPVMEELRDGSYRSRIYPDSRHRKHDTAGIDVRVIEYDVIGPGDSRTQFRVITSFVDPEAAPAEALADMYGRRWEIELCFDELKTHQRGAQMVLRSKTPDGVLQEVYGHLLAHYAIRALIAETAREFDEDPLRYSFTRVLRAARRSIESGPSFSP